MVVNRFRNSAGFEGTRGLITLLAGLLLFFIARELIVRAAITSIFSEGISPRYYAWSALEGIGLALAIGGPIWYWVGKPIRVATGNIDTTRANVSSLLSIAIPVFLAVGVAGFIIGGNVTSIQNSNAFNSSTNLSEINPSPNESQADFEITITPSDNLTVSENVSVNLQEDNATGAITELSPTYTTLGGFELQVGYNFSAEMSIAPTIRVRDGRGNIVTETSAFRTPATVELPASAQTDGGSFTVELVTDGETLDSQEIEFDGADLQMTDFHVSTSPSYDDRYDIDKVQLTLQNQGDVPVRPSEMTVEIGSQETVEMLFLDETVQPGSDTPYEQSTFGTVSQGRYDVTVTVKSEDGVLDRFSTTVQIG